MDNIPQLIVMLTYNDLTVENAAEIFEACKDTKAQFWGFKERPLPLAQMKALFARMKECGKTTVLEVVAYTEDECLEGAKMALDCGCDILMGTLYFDSVNDFCKNHRLQYMPFVGEISGRPSIFSGNMDDIIASANRCIKNGVDGFDLLGYRYVGDAVTFNKRFVREVNAPVCIAGSVNSYQRLDELKVAAPWAFTIGSAFFKHTFGDSFSEQINRVCEYMCAPPEKAYREEKHA